MIHIIIMILGIGLGVVLLALIRGQMLVTRTYTVNEHSENRVRITAIADLHGNAKGHKKNQLIERIQKSDPDLIVYLGDMVDRNHVDDSIGVLLSLTESLNKIAPVYYVDGNHELDLKSSSPEMYEHVIERMSELGAMQLENETVSVEIQKKGPGSEKNVTVNICGISTHYYWGDEEFALTERLRAMDGINVLICHYPESVIWYKVFEGGEPDGTDLKEGDSGNGHLDVALCGHTHGGLVRVPFKGGVYAPEQSLWPAYDLGKYDIFSDTTWYDYGGGSDAEYLGTMIISGGLAGEHGVPRVNNPREVSVVDVGER